MMKIKEKAFSLSFSSCSCLAMKRKWIGAMNWTSKPSCL